MQRDLFDAALICGVGVDGELLLGNSRLLRASGKQKAKTQKKCKEGRFFSLFFPPKKDSHPYIYYNGYSAKKSIKYMYIYNFIHNKQNHLRYFWRWFCFGYFFKPNCSMESSLILYLRILPAAFIGKVLVKMK